VRSGEEVEAVMLMRIAEDLKDLTLLTILLLLVSFTWFIVIPIVIHILHPPEEVLNKFLILSQIAVALGTIIMAIVTAESVKAMREALKVEKLRESFKAIAKELHRARKYVEMNLEDVRNMLEAPRDVIPFDRIPLGNSNTPKDAIRKDFELHYRKGLKLLKHIEKCNSKIDEYNEKYEEFRNWLDRSVVEKLKEAGISVDPDGSTYVCAARINDEWRILLFVSPEECEKRFPKESKVLHVYNHVAAVLVGLNEVLDVHESEEELSKELASIYCEIRSSDEFRRYLNDLRSMAENEVKPCLKKLKDELDKVIDDIMQKYVLSEQEVAAKED